MEILVLSYEDVIELIPISKCIDIISSALADLARGQVYLPLRTMVRPPDGKGLMSLMPAYISGKEPVFGLKSICVFPNNRSVGKDAHQGSVLLFSPETGELLAVLNASAITAIRTAAVSGVATNILARKDAQILGIIGAGVQARTHLAAIAAVRPIKQVKIMDKFYENAQKYVNELSASYPFPIIAVETGEEAVRDADIIITVTNSSEPVLRRNWIAPGAHLNAVGACSPNAREIDTATVLASKLYVDRKESTLNEAGDYILAGKEGAIGPNHIRGEIGELLIGKVSGRTSDEEITLFKALGLAVEDLATAQYAYLQARRRQIGTWAQF